MSILRVVARRIFATVFVAAAFFSAWFGLQRVARAFEAAGLRLWEKPISPLEPDDEGNYPGVEYARASLARKIIRDRVAAGLSQRELAKLAGVRVETLCRIETGKHTPSVPTVTKIDRALRTTRPRKRRSK